ncbi:MAG: hypothetical protein NVS9B3_09320 [Gemmatimonadaceae bacterium]
MAPVSVGTASATPRVTGPRVPVGPGPLRATHAVPEHLADWQLPPKWRWGTEGFAGEHRHYQEVVDALGRSLSLVTAPNPAHHAWLAAEARQLAHRNHPAMPTTYHYWASFEETRRGPGYLRRWIAGESIRARLARLGAGDVMATLQLLRGAGSALAYLHDGGSTHGAVGPDTVWRAPTGRLWLLGWQWALARGEVPVELAPDPASAPVPPEWSEGVWAPTPASDQWQLAALCFASLTGELPPPWNAPPVTLVFPECPQGVAACLDRALRADPGERHESLALMLRALDRGIGLRTAMVSGLDEARGAMVANSDEARLRWATGDDYEVLAQLGRGTFGSVWRVRDLSLGREVALKMLHPHVARDETAVSRFRREARHAAQLAHPAIVPIYDWDSSADVSWYTMELAEGGSLAELVASAGPRSVDEIASQVDGVLDALAAAHAVGVIHRDLKPENIVIDRYRRWRITDFGIANVTGEEVAGTSGTPAFAAPEQLLGEPQGPGVDCFALGAIVAFALTGRPPFGDSDARAILASQLAGSSDLTPLHGAVAVWIARGLAVDVDVRFQDAGDMQRAWREAAAAAGSEDTRRPWWLRWLAPEPAERAG